MPHIAVVDDDASILNLIDEALTEQGWEVTSCTDGASLLAAIQERRPDLVLLDVWLTPPESGWEILEHLKTDPTTRDIPAIVCSGDPSHLQDQHDAWIKDYVAAVLVKPFAIDDLHQCVNYALSSAASRRTGEVQPDRASHQASSWQGSPGES